MQVYTFDHILELVEAMSEDEQQTLFHIIHQRRIERRRDEIAANIIQAKEEYQRGTVVRGTAEDIMTELFE